MTIVATAFTGLPLAAQAQIDTPMGPMTALATARGLAGLWFVGQKDHPGKLDAPVDASNPHIVATREWLRAYWSGDEPRADALKLDLHGTAFQRAVWTVLCDIGYGRTRSYGEVAALVGGGAAPRPTGTAVGRNPVSVIVPCHRVIGANGSLTGYSGGLHRKERLLQHERILLT